MGQGRIEARPIDFPGDGRVEPVEQGVSVAAIGAQRHQRVAHLHFRRVAGLAALDDRGVFGDRPVEHRVPEPEIERPFPRTPVIEPDIFVDDRVPQVETEHEGEHVPGFGLAQGQERGPGPGGDAFEKRSAEPFEPDRGVVVGLLEERANFRKDRRVGVLDDLPGHGQGGGADAKLFFELPPARALHGREKVRLGGPRQGGDRPGEARHGEKPGLPGQPVHVRGDGKREILPHEHLPVQSFGFPLQGLLERKQDRASVHPGEQAHMALVGARGADKKRALAQKRRKQSPQAAGQGQKRVRHDEFQRQIHAEKRGDADRPTVLVQPGVAKDELVRKSALLQGFVPPAAFQGRREAGVPQRGIELGLGGHDAHVAVGHHPRPATRLAPTKISPTPVQRSRSIRSCSRLCDRRVTATKLRLPSGKATLTGKKRKAQV